MADIEKTIKELEEFRQTLHDFRDVYEEQIVSDAIELLKTYSAILNEEPFQCKDCEYYGNKYRCPCYETKYPILNFSCADGIRRNRKWFSDKRSEQDADSSDKKEMV